jgi:hypothetical protein
MKTRVATLDQGCDLEADVVPTMARTVPELPRPLNRSRLWRARIVCPLSTASLIGG